MTETDARSHLERLRNDLQGRGWEAELNEGREPTLRVANPTTPALKDDVICREGGLGWEFRWSWGPTLGLATETHKVVDRIVHILRSVGE